MHAGINIKLIIKGHENIKETQDGPHDGCMKLPDAYTIDDAIMNHIFYVDPIMLTMKVVSTVCKHTTQSSNCYFYTGAESVFSIYLFIIVEI